MDKTQSEERSGKEKSRRTYQLKRKSATKTKESSEYMAKSYSTRWPMVWRKVVRNDTKRDAGCNVKKLGLLSLGQWEPGCPSDSFKQDSDVRKIILAAL